MATEELIKQILSKHPEFSRKQILERIEHEKRRIGGLISEETILRMIAAEFGLEIPQN